MKMYISSVLTHLTHNSRCHSSSSFPSATATPTSALLLRSLIICTTVAHATGCECSQRRLSAAISKANPIPIWQTCHTTPHRAASHDLIFKIEKSASAKPKGRSIKLGFNTRQGGHTARQRERGRERERAVWADWMNPQSCWAANPIEVATITKLKLKPHATWLHGATGQRTEGDQRGVTPYVVHAL